MIQKCHLHLSVIKYDLQLKIIIFKKKISKRRKYRRRRKSDTSEKIKHFFCGMKQKEKEKREKNSKDYIWVRHLCQFMRSVN